MRTFYDPKENIFLREDSEGDYVVYFPEKREHVPAEEFDSEGLQEVVRWR